MFTIYTTSTCKSDLEEWSSTHPVNVCRAITSSNVNFITEGAFTVATNTADTTITTSDSAFTGATKTETLALAFISLAAIAVAVPNHAAKARWARSCYCHSKP